MDGWRLTKSYELSGAIGAYNVAAFTTPGDGSRIEPASSPAQRLVGSTGRSTGGAGEIIDIDRSGFSQVRLGGAVAAGDPLTTDATARAVIATDGDRYFGFAEEPGEVDDVVDYLVAYGFWTGDRTVTPTSTMLSDTITERGITWTLAAPVPVGRYVSGDYFAVNGVVASATPLSVTNNEGTYDDEPISYTGRTVHGMVRDPGSEGGTGMALPQYQQGFDSLPTAGNGTGEPAMGYSQTLNIDPALTGQSISGPATLIKSRSRLSGVKTNVRAKLAAWSFLTLTDRVPPQGSFRRWLGLKGVQQPIFFESDIDWSALITLPRPAGATPLVAANLLAKLGPFETYWNNQDTTRGLNGSEIMDDYNGGQARDIIEAIWFTMTAETSDADRKAVAIKLLQIGLDVYDALEAGRRWFAVNRSYGGHFMWYKLVLVYAARLLRNAAAQAEVTKLRAWLNDGQRHVFSEDWMAGIVVNRDMIDTKPPAIQNADRIQPQGYPEWMENSVEWRSYPYSMRENSISLDLEYRRNTNWGYLSIALLARLFGFESLWNHPTFFLYLDAFYNEWEQRTLAGRDQTALEYFPAYSLKWVQTYYKANSPRFNGTGAPTLARREARRDYAWIEASEPFDIAYQPAATDLVVTVDGVAQTLAPVTATASGNVSQTSSNIVNPIITISGASGTVRAGMLVVCAGLNPATFVTAVSGNTIAISNKVPATFAAGTPISFRSVFVHKNALVARLPTSLTSAAQAVTIGYTAPGTGFVRNLRGSGLGTVVAAAATNRTGVLPAAATTKSSAYVGAVPAASRQYSGTTSPAASQVTKRLCVSMRFLLKSALAANDQLLAASLPGSGTFRLQASSATALQMLIGGSANQQVIVSGLSLPLNTLIDLHIMFDGTQTTQTAAKKAAVLWGGNGGTRTATTSGSVGTLDGSFAANATTWFGAGMYIGAEHSNGAGLKIPDIAFQEVLVRWGDETMSLPADFSGSAFDAGASWGGNGELLYGVAPQRYYAGSLEEWNSSVINRGAGGGASLVPQRVSSDGTPLPLYVLP